ncbi:hypothetical protein HPT29_018455 [Microvirga terrae]|uniref:Uncharacterized protein n=1 Tax=Microvirga terrae TaxID=2740529 RepID=A0ABY5RMJ4_9HYPH|nr:hypothetical protein [Microvirga terrae]UVF18455.1 hypothetical protein HPT29_018455 [Microvirga terrae]
MQGAAPVAFGIAAALHNTIEATRAERAAWKAEILQGLSEQKAADAVARLGYALAEAHHREADLREELAAMRLRALRAEGQLARLARQH